MRNINESKIKINGLKFNIEFESLEIDGQFDFENQFNNFKNYVAQELRDIVLDQVSNNLKGFRIEMNQKIEDLKK